MEYSNWAKSMPQPSLNPNPNPYPDQSTHSHSHYPTPYGSYPSSLSYYPQNPNPNYVFHNPAYSAPDLGSNPNPPGTDPYSSYSHTPVGVYETYAQYQTVDMMATTTAQQPPVSVQNWSVMELVHQYGGVAPQNGVEQLVPAISNPTTWTTTPLVNNPRGPWKKGPKKIKIVQSQFCEVCKITCDTKEVLDLHKMGKKHLKNLEKLKSIATATPSAVTKNALVIGPQEKSGGIGNSVSGQKRSKGETAEDLETKKRKIMEGGVAASAVRACGICNVVCNSETVFKTHLTGHKHIAMLKKLSVQTT